MSYNALDGFTWNGEGVWPCRWPFTKKAAGVDRFASSLERGRVGLKGNRGSTDDFIVISFGLPCEHCVITPLANRPDKRAIVVQLNYRIMRSKLAGGNIDVGQGTRYVDAVLLARYIPGRVIDNLRDYLYTFFRLRRSLECCTIFLLGDV